MQLLFHVLMNDIRLMVAINEFHTRNPHFYYVSIYNFQHYVLYHIFMSKWVNRHEVYSERDDVEGHAFSPVPRIQHPISGGPYLRLSLSISP